MNIILIIMDESSWEGIVWEGIVIGIHACCVLEHIA
jgi:hypothetical protein